MQCHIGTAYVGIDVQIAPSGEAKVAGSGQVIVNIEIIPRRKADVRTIEQVKPRAQREIATGMGEGHRTIRRGVVVQAHRVRLRRAGVVDDDAAAAAVGNIRINGIDILRVSGNWPGGVKIHAAAIGVERIDGGVLAWNPLTAALAALEIIAGFNCDRRATINDGCTQQLDIAGGMGVEASQAGYMEIASCQLGDIAGSGIDDATVGDEIHVPAINLAARTEHDVTTVIAVVVRIA